MRSFTAVLLAAWVLSGCALLRGVGGSRAATSASFPTTHEAPYPVLASYFGYFGAETKPDTDEGKPARFYLYAWVPNAAPEIGVRVVSPTLKWAQPQDGDLVAEEFEAHSTEPTSFDSYVSLERCIDGLNPEDVLAGCDKWTQVAENDDASDGVPPGAGNAVARAVSDPDLAERALIRGLYRIGVWAAKGTTPAGTFWVQVGADRDFGGAEILLDRSLKGLHRKIP